NFAAPQSEPGQRFPDVRQHETGSAANFEKIFRVWKIVFQCPAKQAVAGTKPETAGFEFGKSVERTRVESFALFGEFWSESQMAAEPFRLVKARRTLPARTVQRFAAVTTESHQNLSFMPAFIFKSSHKYRSQSCSR